MQVFASLMLTQSRVSPVSLLVIVASVATWLGAEMSNYNYSFRWLQKLVTTVHLRYSFLPACLLLMKCSDCNSVADPGFLKKMIIDLHSYVYSSLFPQQSFFSYIAIIANKTAVMRAFQSDRLLY